MLCIHTVSTSNDKRKNIKITFKISLLYNVTARGFVCINCNCV